MADTAVLSASPATASPATASTPVGVSIPAEASTPDDAGSRGALHLDDTVVRKVAELAALDLQAVVRHSAGLSRVTGRGLPRAEATVAGGRARIAIEVAVAWPHPLAEVALAVRDCVVTRLRELTGITADAVDVSISSVIVQEATPPPRRVL